MKRFRAYWRWRIDNKLAWWLIWEYPAEFKTWFVEAKKRQGKTRWMARKAVEDMRRGVRVACNFTVRDRLHGTQSERADNWIDVLRLSVDALEKGTPLKFYIDEFHLWMDSRSYKATPVWFRGWLAQSGHYGVGLCGSVQNLRRLEIVARELVDELYVVRKMYFRLFGLWGPIVPLQWLGRVDVDSVGDKEMGDAAAYRFESWSPMFPRWWAGYDTRELIQVEAWESDAALEAEVALLTARAAELVAPGVIEAFTDIWEVSGASASAPETLSPFTPLPDSGLVGDDGGEPVSRVPCGDSRAL